MENHITPDALIASIGKAGFNPPSHLARGIMIIFHYLDSKSMGSTGDFFGVSSTRVNQIMRQTMNSLFSARLVSDYKFKNKRNWNKQELYPLLAIVYFNINNLTPKQAESNIIHREYWANEMSVLNAYTDERQYSAGFTSLSARAENAFKSLAHKDPRWLSIKYIKANISQIKPGYGIGSATINEILEAVNDE